MKLTNVITSIGTAVRKHSPEILTGLGISGLITTTVVAVRVTPKAIRLLDAKKKELHKDKLSAVETIKTTWKCYLPACIVASTSVMCIIGGTKVNMRRNAALATAYTISESALKDYRNKVIENFGEKKDISIRDAIAEDKLRNNPVTNKEVFVTEKGNTLCYDVISGRYFKSDIELIKKAVNELNRRMISEMSISLNDFYYEIGLPNIDLGDKLGWNIESGLIDISFTSKLASDDTPCLVINYDIRPDYDFN